MHTSEITHKLREGICAKMSFECWAVCKTRGERSSARQRARPQLNEKSEWSTLQSATLTGWARSSACLSQRPRPRRLISAQKELCPGTRLSRDTSVQAASHTGRQSQSPAALSPCLPQIKVYVGLCIAEGEGGREGGREEDTSMLIYPSYSPERGLCEGEEKEGWMYRWIDEWMMYRWMYRWRDGCKDE